MIRTQETAMTVVTGVVVWRRRPKHVSHIILCNATVVLGRSRLEVLKGFLRKECYSEYEMTCKC